MRLQTDQENFGLIREMSNGGVIKNLTIESSSMIIRAPYFVYSFGFFVGKASTLDEAGNITISDCHSINNTITITGTNIVFHVGFIAGYLKNSQQTRFILVSDCSTKYSNLLLRGQSISSFGGNFGHAGLFSLF